MFIRERPNSENLVVGYIDGQSTLDAVSAALADPTRRVILTRIAEGDASVNEIAAPFNISQPAVSRHLKVLERAGLIGRDIDEQCRPARLRGEKMVFVVDWLTAFRKFWDISFDQLDDVLLQMKQVDARKQAMNDLPEYSLDRIFNAPRDLVWRAWADSDMLHRWNGPNIETLIHQFDLKPGGEWLNEMKWGDKSDFSKMVFQEVIAPAKLVWHLSSTDAGWNIITSPMMADWPRVLLTTAVFEDKGDTTNVRLTQVPVGPTDAEIACFAGHYGRNG